MPVEADPAADAVRGVVDRLRIAMIGGRADDVAALLTEDVVFVNRTGEVVRGRDRIRADLARRLVTPHHVQIDSELALRVHDDLAYRVGGHTLRIVRSDRILVPDTTTDVLVGRDVSIFARQPDGAWKLEALILSQ
jgi:uncharacterized protein (TIGR02246 family)